MTELLDARKIMSKSSEDECVKKSKPIFQKRTLFSQTRAVDEPPRRRLTEDDKDMSTCTLANAWNYSVNYVSDKDGNPQGDSAGECCFKSS